MSTSELSQSQSPKRSQQVSGQVMEEYTNPYLPQSKYNGNMEISDNFGGNTGNKNNDNKNNVDVSNFDNSVVPLSESKNVNNRGDPSKAHKSFNNTKGTTVDKDGKVRDHSNLIQSMNNYTTIQTDFKLCKNFSYNFLFLRSLCCALQSILWICRIRKRKIFPNEV